MAQPGADGLGTVGREFRSRRPDHSENYCKYEKDVILLKIMAFFRDLMSTKKFSFFEKFTVDQKVLYRAGLYFRHLKHQDVVSDQADLKISR